MRAAWSSGRLAIRPRKIFRSTFNLTLSKENQISLMKVMRELTKNPMALLALLRFGKQSRHAGRTFGEIFWMDMC